MSGKNFVHCSRSIWASLLVKKIKEICALGEDGEMEVEDIRAFIGRTDGFAHSDKAAAFLLFHYLLQNEKGLAEMDFSDIEYCLVDLIGTVNRLAIFTIEQRGINSYSIEALAEFFYYIDKAHAFAHVFIEEQLTGAK